MMPKKNGPGTAALFAGAALLLVLISAVPAMGLWLSERGALAEPHARTAQAGTLSMTCDDMYITRMLKKLALARAGGDPGYTSAPFDAQAMTAYSGGDWQGNSIRSLIETAHAAGFLPDAWYESVREAADAYYVSADSLGFLNYIADARREPDRGFYAVGFTVEVQSGKIVGLFAAGQPEEQLPDPDTDAVLSAFMSYLGVEKANDWLWPAQTPYEENSLYSVNAELLLTAQAGSYSTWPWNSAAAWSGESRERRFFCVNAQYFPAEEMQRKQAYTRSFAGYPDQPVPTGELYRPEWVDQWSGQLSLSPAGDACYEAVTTTARTDENGTDMCAVVLKTDLATRVQSPLCSVAGCGHDAPSCPAFIQSRGEVAASAVGDRVLVLYRADGEDAEEGAMVLDTMDAAGRARIRLCTFPAAWNVYPGRLFATDGQSLYGFADGAFPQSIRDSQRGMRVDLETGALSFFDAKDLYFLGVGGTCLFFAQEQGVCDTALLPPAAGPEALGMENSRAEGQRLVTYDPTAGVRRMSDLGAIEQTCRDAGMTSLTAIEGGKIFLTGRREMADGRLTEELWQFDVQTEALERLCRVPLERNSTVSDVTYQRGTGGQHDALRIRCADRDRYDAPRALWWYDLESGDLTSSPVWLSNELIYLALPRRCTADGRWLVQREQLEAPWGGIRFSYALAPQEWIDGGGTADSLLQRIAPWEPAPALG